MDEFELRLVLLGIASVAALVWLASALRRAPRRRSRWQRYRDAVRDESQE